MYFGVFWCILVYGVFWCILVYGVFWGILVYFGGFLNERLVFLQRTIQFTHICTYCGERVLNNLQLSVNKT